MSIGAATEAHVHCKTQSFQRPDLGFRWLGSGASQDYTLHPSPMHGNEWTQGLGLRV